MINKLSVVAEHNAVIILDCLSDYELQTGLNLRTALRDIPYELRNLSVCYAKIRSRADFADAFATIYKDCLEKTYPIIHIEAHGDEENGLELSDGSLLVSWDELNEILQHLNLIASNNIGVVLAACSGIYLASKMTWRSPSPFAYLIAPTGAINAGRIAREMPLFYASIFETNNLDYAYAKLSGGYALYHARLHFLNNLGDVYREHFIGQGKLKTRENQLTFLNRHKFAKNILGMKKLREIAKAVSTPTSERYEEQSKIFFHGQVPISFDDFISYVKNLG